MEPTIGQFSFILQLVDAGLIRASFRFADIRSLLGSIPGVLTPDVDAAIRQVESNPQLIDIGVQTLRDALTKYPANTPISVAFGGGATTPTAPTTPVANPITLTPAQLQDAYKALAGIAATSSKALSEFLDGPNGQRVVNTFYAEMQDLARLQADVAAGKVTRTAFLDKLIGYSADTSALALQSTYFFTGKTPTSAALAELIDSPTNTTDLTDFAYAKYNTENKYIDFSVNQAMSGSGAAAFRAAYDSLSFRDAAIKLYDAIIGNSKAAAAGININAAIDYIVAQQSYFNAYGFSALGAKAAVAGYLMSKGLEANIGVYNEATRAFLTKAYDGTAVYGGDLLAKAAVAEVEAVGQPAAHVDFAG